MSQLQVHLYRDSFSTPWGIRLQGGKDVGQTLVIQRVFANSPAEGYLQRGDIILKLNNAEAADLTHKRAQELFNSCGGQILLSIKRVQFTQKELPNQPKESKAYRTVPLELTGPGTTPGPKFGGSKVDFGTCYTQRGVPSVPPSMHRQTSKPWEDQQMLHKVQDTLSHISYPYAPPTGSVGAAPTNISCVNMYSSAPAYSVAPPAYVPGPPPEQETGYVDPFPNYQPTGVSAADEEDDYEFVPVSQRRSQFNKADFSQSDRRPIKPKRAPPVFAPVAAPVAAPAARMPTTPVMAPAPFMPADGEVVQPAVPAWAGTLSSAGGPKLWDGTKPSSVCKPARSASPTKKPSTPVGFKPTQTQALDFSGGDTEDGPRVMHLQYNSPLDMYSKQNVEETLQGQTSAAMGGGNTAKWLTNVQQRGVEDSQPATNFSPVEASHFRSNARQSAPVAKPPTVQPIQSKGAGQIPRTLPFTPVSFKPKEIPIPKALQVMPPPVDIPLYSQSEFQAPPPRPNYAQPLRSFSPQTTRPFSPQPKAPAQPSGLVNKQWTPVESPKCNSLNSRPQYTAPAPRRAAPPEPEPEPEPAYRPWGSVTAIPPPSLKLAKEPEPTPSKVRTPDADRDRVFAELTSALQRPKTFPRGSYAAKEKMGSGGSFVPSVAPMSPRVSNSIPRVSHSIPSYTTPTYARVSPQAPAPAPVAPPVQPVYQAMPPPQITGYSRVSAPGSQPNYYAQSQTPAHVPVRSAVVSSPARVSSPIQPFKFGHVSAPVAAYSAPVSYMSAEQETDHDAEDEYVSASELEPEYYIPPKPKAKPSVIKPVSAPKMIFSAQAIPARKPVSAPETVPASEVFFVPKRASEPEPVILAQPVYQQRPAPKPEPVYQPEPLAEPEPVSEPKPVSEIELVTEAIPDLEPGPVSALEPVSEPEPVAVTEPVPQPETVSEPEPKSEPAPVAEPEVEPHQTPGEKAEPSSTETESVAVQEQKVEQDSAAEPEAESAPEHEVKSEPISASEIETESAPVQEVVPVETEVEPVPAAGSVSESEPVADVVPETEAESVPAPELEPVSVAEPESVSAPEAESVSAPEAEPVSVTDPEHVHVAEPEQVHVTEPEPVSVTEPEQVHVTEAEQVHVAEPEAVTVSLPEGETVSVSEGESVTVSQTETVTVSEGETVTVSQQETVTVSQQETVTVSQETVTVSESESISVSISEQEGESVAVPDAESVSVTLAEHVSVSGSDAEAALTLQVATETADSQAESEHVLVIENSESVPQPESQSESVSESFSVTELEPIAIPEPELEACIELQADVTCVVETEASDLQTSPEAAAAPAAAADKETDSATVVETLPEVTPTQLTSNVEESNSSKPGETRNPDLAAESN